MRTSLGHKLFLILLVVSGLVVAAMMGFMSWSVERGFLHLVEARQQEKIHLLASELANLYATSGNWEELAGDKHRWGRMLVELRDPGVQKARPWHSNPARRRPSIAGQPPFDRAALAEDRPLQQQGFADTPMHDSQSLANGDYFPARDRFSDSTGYVRPYPEEHRPPPGRRHAEVTEFRHPAPGTDYPPHRGYFRQAPEIGHRPPVEGFPSPPERFINPVGIEPRAPEPDEVSSGTADMNDRHPPGRDPLTGKAEDSFTIWPPARSSNNAGNRHLVKPLAHRLMLLDAGKRLIYGRKDRVDRLDLYPITYAKQVVGYLGVLPGAVLEETLDIRFLKQQADTFWLIALGIIALSALFSLPMARRFVRPLREFTEGSRALAAGHYKTRIKVTSNDELGQLAEDFNALAKALDRNEQMRRNTMADISHELRNPLAILRGELEALQDGVRDFDRMAVDSLYSDLLRLTRLVDDLYQLSMTDLGALSYRMASTNPVEILRDDVESMGDEFKRSKIHCSIKLELTHRVVIKADPDRLSQLFRNLLKNTLRYTDSGGRLEITISRLPDQLLIDFEDSVPAVASAELPHLFERFYRVETSRSRAHNGAGLGLAICQNIAEAHGGKIVASQSRLGGLWLRLELPLQRS